MLRPARVMGDIGALRQRQLDALFRARRAAACGVGSRSACGPCTGLLLPEVFAGRVPAPCLGCGRPGPGKAGAARPEDGSGAGAQRHGGVRTGGASPLAKRGLRRTTPGPDRAKPRQGAGTRPADTRGSEGAGV